jgi:plasmid stability protein
MTRQLTIRGVPDEVAERLERLSRARGRSVNATVNEILEQTVGPDPRSRRLQRYVTWSPEELDAFSSALAEQRTVDDEYWR